jgi:hypothetical protein
VKRILVMLGMGKHSETMCLPETMIDAELARLTRCVPQTNAERQFHRWLVEWKEKNAKVKG